MNELQYGILIVDDDADVRQSIILILKAAGFKNLYTAKDGLDALSTLQQKGDEIYVMLLDIRMPNMTGTDLLKHLINTHKHIVGVIIITGHGDPKLAADFYNTGNNRIVTSYFIDKPFRDEVLLDDLNNTIENIVNKRVKNLNRTSKIIFDKIDQINSKLNTIDAYLKKQPGFLAQLGLDLVRAIIIAVAIISILSAGIPEFIQAVAFPDVRQ